MRCTKCDKEVKLNEESFIISYISDKSAKIESQNFFCAECFKKLCGSKFTEEMKIPGKLFSNPY